MNKLLDGEVQGILADLKATSGRLDGAIAEVTDRVPAIAQDLQAMIARANDLVGNVDSIVSGNREQINAFVGAGLPQFVRFLRESRQLVGSIERLVDKIERNPARFLLGNQSQEFRR